jgi:hypothetical protein
MSTTESKDSGIRGKVIASLITMLIASFITFVIPGGWQWLFTQGQTFWQWFSSTASVPVWLLAILSLVALAALAVGVVLVYAATRKEGTCAPDTTAVFFDIRWRWRHGQHGIYDLAAFCPHCDLQMHPQATVPGYPDHSPVLYHCDDCRRDIHRFDHSFDTVEDKVKRKIQQRLREYGRRITSADES